jgi:hypothetical protein
MAIEHEMTRLMLAEAAKRPFHGSVLQLGRQKILFTESQLRKWAAQARASISAAAASTESLSTASLARDTRKQLDDWEFFRLLGFDEVASCDASDYEDPTFILDLNKQVEEKFHNRFDMILDGGTMEHIFNVPTVFANIGSMLKVGGRIIHIAPSSNMIDHGFYSFSPTLFGDYYGANGYLLRTLSLFECVSWSGKWTIFDCLGGQVDNRLGRIANAKMAGVFCLAEKTAQSTSDVIPTQSHFSRVWDATVSGTSPARQNALMRALKANAPQLAELLFWGRALLWRAPGVRRAAMPPIARK